jgi:hypothetical protein
MKTLPKPITPGFEARVLSVYRRLSTTHATDHLQSHSGDPEVHGVYRPRKWAMSLQMRTIVTGVAVFCLVSQSASLIQAQNNLPKAYGPAGASCGAWMAGTPVAPQGTGGAGNREGYLLWTEGYVSGAGYVLAGRDSILLMDTVPESSSGRASTFRGRLPFFEGAPETIRETFLYQPTADGQRFVVTAPVNEGTSPRLTVVLNWRVRSSK